MPSDCKMLVGAKKVIFILHTFPKNVDDSFKRPTKLLCEKKNKTIEFTKPTIEYAMNYHQSLDILYVRLLRV